MELRRRGGALVAAGPGTTLALLSRSRWTSALLTLAAPAAGITPFPLNPDLPSAVRDPLLTRAGVTQALAEANMELPPGVRRLDVERQARSHGRALSAGHIQLILATSGSSGVPKGVMLSGANLVAGVQAFLSRFPLHTGDLWLNCLPLFHIGGLAIFYRCFAVGATVMLHQRFDAERVWADLQTAGVTHLSLVPAMLARLLDAAGDRPPPERLKTLLLGGGPLSAPLAERARDAGWPLCVSYGMTETSALCAAVCLPGVAWQEGLAGTPLQGFEVRIGNGQPGETGVIRLRGRAVMYGYLNRERSAGEGVVDGWLETSDLGRLDAEGRLWVLGRADDMLLSGGELVPPSQVESLLLRCPGVRAVAVAGIPDPHWGEVTAAWVVGDWEPAALDAWCREHMPAYLRPRRWLRVDALPETASGKPDRRRLREQAR
jgi:O-succinylbenzoic acid--CoA ligase